MVPNIHVSSNIQIRAILSVAILAIVLLVTIQTAAGSAPPIQMETSTDIDEPMPGESVSINTTISNLENNNGRNVVVSYVYLRDADGLDAYRQGENVGSIAPGGSLSIPFSITFNDPGRKQLDLQITVSPQGEDELYTFQKPIYIDVTESDLRGDVRLTSTSVTGRNTITVEGDAANIGGTDVESVLVSIPETDAVSPRPPNGEYYVGGIETSEFGTFELTADVVSGTESVPVNITYITTGEGRDDERITKSQQIPISEAATSAQQAGQPQAAATESPPSGGGPPLGLLGGVGILVVVSILGLVLWRRR